MKEKIITDIPFEEAEYCVFDFETTGTSALQDKVIEIGIARIKKGKIMDTFSSFINPGRPVPYFITQITGITNSDVQDAPYFDEVYGKIKEFVGDSILTAHNLQFDYSFLKHECANYEVELIRNEAICTLRLARKIFPQFPSKSLGSIVKQLRIKHRDVHRGLGDATATAKILIRMFKHLREEHDVDTITDLINFQRHSVAGPGYKIIKKKLQKDTVDIPDSPGVYFFKNSREEIIYIGKAKSLRARLKNYFLNNAMRKSKEIVRRASRLEYHTTNSELTALIAEAELIKKHLPKKNTLLKRYPRSYFIKLSTTNKYPAIEIASEFNFDGNNYYGPYPNRDTTNSLKETADKTFLLRECSDKELQKRRRCYLADIERCLAPCAEEIILDQYKDEIMNVNDYLCGQNQSAVDRLLNRMKELSEKKKFEEAAQIRDVVQSILNQLHKASILAEPINRANVLIEINGSIKNDYMLLLEGKIVFKDYFVNEKNYFDEMLADYFSGSIQIKKELTDKDLETLRIALSWLIKNRNRIIIHYLKEFSSVEEIASNLLLTRTSN